MKKQKGFTLIEVLIVVSIIGLLTSATLIGLGGFRAAGRDSRRASDLRQIQNGLELFYAKNSEYPDALSELTTSGIVKNLPEDPSSGTDYGYSVNAAKSSYILSATLEDLESRLLNDSVTDTTGYSGSATCDNTKGEYCISF